MDHRQDRETDWTRAAPRWLLLALIATGWMVGGFFGHMAWNQYQWRIDEVERRAADPWKAQVGKNAQLLGEVVRDVSYLEERVRKIEGDNLAQKIERLSGQIDRLSDRLSRQEKER